MGLACSLVEEAERHIYKTLLSMVSRDRGGLMPHDQGAQTEWE